MKRLCTILVAVLLVCAVAAAQQRSEPAAPPDGAPIGSDCDIDRP